MIYDEDSDFGSVNVIDTDQFQQPESLSSQRSDLDTFFRVISRTVDQTFGSVG